MANQTDHLDRPVLDVARRDVASLREDLTIQQALDAIRHGELGEKIIYFYVVNRDGRLVGVLPTRRLLTSPPERRIAEAMIQRVVALPKTATVLEACEAFVLHRFLAFPIVDEQRQLVGVVDVGLLTDEAFEAFDLVERERMDALFESIGVHVSQLKEASPLRAFRFRFPWLLASITSGTGCALLASLYETTLEKSILLAFFLTLVLGLAESVSIQSMTLTIQTLVGTPPTLGWYLRSFRREAGTALMLGAASGLVVGLIVWLWRGAGWAAFSIGGSISLALCAACFFGLSVPSVLHAWKLDPKIAAGPLTLALTDVFTLLFYFTLAAVLL
jgi:magnesium transporter